MDQTLSKIAEAAFEQHDDGNVVVRADVFGWLLAEAHFAGTVTKVLRIELGSVEMDDDEAELLVEIAKAFRYFRKKKERENQVRPKGDMHAVGPHEP